MASSWLFSFFFLSQFIEPKSGFVGQIIRESITICYAVLYPALIKREKSSKNDDNNNFAHKFVCAEINRSQKARTKIPGYQGLVMQLENKLV